MPVTVIGGRPIFPADTTFDTVAYYIFPLAGAVARCHAVAAAVGWLAAWHREAGAGGYGGCGGGGAVSKSLRLAWRRRRPWRQPGLRDALLRIAARLPYCGETHRLAARRRGYGCGCGGSWPRWPVSAAAVGANSVTTSNGCGWRISAGMAVRIGVAAIKWRLRISAVAHRGSRRNSYGRRRRISWPASAAS